MVFNVIITGIGGQGTVSVGHLLGKIFHEAGENVVAAETHGMSQRGGSVVFHLRIGKTFAPIITRGTADVIIAGEPMEALRVLDYLKPNGVVLTNTYGILSPIALQLGMKYPHLDELINELKSWPAKVIPIDIAEVTKDADVGQGDNLILLGAFTKLGLIDLDMEIVKKTIEQRWPKVVDINMRALELGYSIIEKSQDIQV
jgi:indolepyruvate ferredoxin oxidoreductase beta subunit